MTMMDSSLKGAGAKTGEKKALNLNEFCDRVAQASYLVASEHGFRGSYLAFLADFQKALGEVLPTRFLSHSE